MTRQQALQVEAQVRNVSAESYVSARYPTASSKVASDARISGSSSMTATIFRRSDIGSSVKLLLAAQPVGWLRARSRVTMRLKDFLCRYSAAGQSKYALCPLTSCESMPIVCPQEPTMCV